MATKFERAMETKIEKTPTTAAPRGYKLVREGKTFQTSFVLRQSTREALDDIRAELGKTRNELVNDILEEYIDRYYKERGKE